MLLIVVVAVAGAALGILLTTATVPRVTVAPFVSVVALTALVAAAIFTSDSGNIAAALAFVAMHSLAATIHGAAMWKRAMPQIPRSLAWFCWMHFARPDFLRSLYKARQAVG